MINPTLLNPGCGTCYECEEPECCPGDFTIDIDGVEKLDFTLDAWFNTLWQHDYVNAGGGSCLGVQTIFSQDFDLRHGVRKRFKFGPQTAVGSKIRTPIELTFFQFGKHNAFSSSFGVHNTDIADEIDFGGDLLWNDWYRLIYTRRLITYEFNRCPTNLEVPTVFSDTFVQQYIMEVALSGGTPPPEVDDTTVDTYGSITRTLHDILRHDSPTSFTMGAKVLLVGDSADASLQTVDEIDSALPFDPIFDIPYGGPQWIWPFHNLTTTPQWLL